MEIRKTTHQNGERTRTRASTGDILGSTREPVPVSDQWAAQYNNLLQLRDHMLRRKGELVEAAREEQPAYGLHLADAGTDQYDMDFALSMISAEQDALYEVEQAINRIRTGTYGVCEMTGEPIEGERLKAIPWTRFSAAAQKQLEDGGLNGRIKLAARRTFADSTEPTEDEDDEE